MERTDVPELQGGGRKIQSLGSLVFALVGEWARDYESRNYDGRNEATCKRASDMIQGLPADERDNFWMPYV
jgi:hypothetical protein